MSVGNSVQDRDFEALHLQDEHLPLMLATTWNLIEIRRYVDAIKQTDRILAIDPENFLGNYYRAIAYLRNRSFVDAEIFAKKALVINPNNAGALHILGCSLKSQRKFQEAEPALRTAISLRPTETNFYTTLTALLNSTSRYDESIEIGVTGLIHDPNHANLHNNLALAFLFLQNPLMAEEHALKALELNSQDAKHHQVMGMVSISKRNFRKAIFSFANAIRLNPTGDLLLDYVNRWRKIIVLLDKILSR